MALKARSFVQSEFHILNLPKFKPVIGFCYYLLVQFLYKVSVDMFICVAICVFIQAKFKQIVVFESVSLLSLQNLT